jgi:hypothetical protein
MLFCCKENSSNPVTLPDEEQIETFVNFSLIDANGIPTHVNSGDSELIIEAIINYNDSNDKKNITDLSGKIKDPILTGRINILSEYLQKN